jgi:hypothetical protein
MNDRSTGPEQTLERVTAASDAPQQDLEPDAESLRQAWLTFGRLLEAVQSPPAAPLEQWRPPPASRRWPLAAAAALAASLLVAASLYWMSGGEGTSGPVLPATNRLAATDGVKPSASADDGLQWDDSLDRQIAQAGEGVALAQSELSHAFGEIDFVRYGIQQTRQDLENSKL